MCTAKIFLYFGEQVGSASREDNIDMLLYSVFSTVCYLLNNII